MKIALACRSTLLEKSLRKFLKGYLAEGEDADLIVSDYPLQSSKPVLRIGAERDADLMKPFSRSRLMIKIEEKIEANRTKDALKHFSIEEESLEERIENAALRFAKELTEIIKEYYEKKK